MFHRSNIKLNAVSFYKYQRLVAEEVSATQSRANSIRFPPSQHIFLNDVLTSYSYVLQLRSGRFLEEFP